MAKDLVVLRGVTESPLSRLDAEVFPFADLRRELTAPGVLRWLGRYRRVEMVVPDLDLMTNPFKSSLLVRLIGRRGGRIVDTQGREEQVTVPRVAVGAWRALRDAITAPGLLRTVDREMRLLDRPPDACPRWKRDRPPVYLRTDLWSGVVAGGSVAHTAGVLHGMRRLGVTPIFFCVDRIPTVDPEVETRRLPLPERFWDVREAPYFLMSETVPDAVERALAGRTPGFVYQRYALGNYAGLKLARRFGVPFVCEFNGSEVWIARHWGEEPLHRENLFKAVERLNLSRADLVVVVSKPMVERARALGAADERILVAPNGVDPETFHPDVDGDPVRRLYRLGDRTVVGFIGTFGAWHGAEILAEAFGRLVARRLDLRDRVALLMVGDGMRMRQVREAVRRHGVEDLVVLTGTVPQAQGPAHLAACDLLASPHVPNPDGTPFFGSPTKLFEYMAMGRGIVASDLDQIGEVLAHGETALLVRPGDPDDLADGLERLVDDPDFRARLGRAAREQAVAEHTWTGHVRKIMEALGSCPA